MITYHQTTLAEIFEETKEIFETDKPAFLTLLENTIDLHEVIPVSFRNHYYSLTGRPRDYSLESMLWALIIQKIFSIPTDQLLLVFLQYSKDLREFCGFTKVPDASKITRFKQAFLDDLHVMFDNLVDLTEPICQAIDQEKASMTIFDSSGIEAFVKENNPKFSNKIIRQLKAYAKSMGFDDSYDPYKAAYGRMPSSAESNHEIKQLYINGHFCYVYKFGMITNGLGIVREICFYNKDFVEGHPDIVVEKKTDSPEEDKSIGDARLLIPTLADFFKKHPLIDPKTFLGDSAFDSVAIYKALLAEDTFGSGRRFSKAYIPLNSRSALKNPDSECSINENGIPCCPHDPDLPMKQEGNAFSFRGVSKIKFVCPKMSWVTDPDGRNHRQCHCEDPCTDSQCGRMVYVYPEQDLRTYPGAIRGTKEWDETYKIRTIVERAINHFKDNLGVAGRRTRDEKTLHADLLIAGICQQITVLVANKIHRHEYIRSLKKLIA